MPVEQLSSDSLLINIEQNFRISAGPGAGKTHWLVEHLKNILHRSNRLHKTRKVACITYTNIGIETIQERLGTSASQVEVSTIHSFLYKHIVKPYAFSISKEYDLNIQKMDGHDDFQVSFSKVKNWIEGHPQKAKLSNPCTERQLLTLPQNKEALSRWLSSLRYSVNNNDVILSSDRSKAYHGNHIYLSNACLDLLEEDLLGFKKKYWKEGVIHHEDVLFFSYQIIQKNPFVLDVIRAKFPYLLIDEFQDSNPIQIEILKQIGEQEAIIGIIGDKAQSIYGFQGATPSQFQSFSLNNFVDYEISNNRRSTNQIINLLNKIRNDGLVQTSVKNIDGEKPVIIIGAMDQALDKARQMCSEDEDVVALSRKNVISNAAKRNINGVSHNEQLLNELVSTDGNRYRSRIIIACIKAIEFARESKFKDAIKELSKRFKNDADKQTQKKKALWLIQSLLSEYDDFKDKCLYHFFTIVKGKLNDQNIGYQISDLRSGQAKTFYEGNLYKDAALCVNIPEDNSLSKTIHKSKGDEFQNVLLILTNRLDLGFITSGNTVGNEEHRIYYVGASRAENKLFISVPSLTEEKRTALANLDLFEFEDLPAT